MRLRLCHLRPVSKAPASAQTALDLKLEALFTYYANALILFNNSFIEGSANVVNLVGTLGGALPYKNATGGSSQGGGTGTGGTGGTGDTGTGGLGG